MILIDADALHEAFDNEGADICADYGSVSAWGFGYRLAHDLIANAPVIDAVEVVRCKDCKHKGWVQEPCHGKSIDYCRVWDCTLRDLETNFCSYGERKNADENESR